MKRNASRYLLAGLVLLALCIVNRSAVVPTWVSPNPRAGIGISASANAADWAHRLGAGWCINWAVLPSSRNSYPQVWQMVRPLISGGTQTAQQVIVATARRHPGNVWIIGNEPDNIWQDDLAPEDFARFYHDQYVSIKNADPSASIAVGGISESTPIRLRYLDQVLASYRSIYGTALPADWWTLHGYVLQEKRGSWGVDIPPGFSEQNGMLYTIADHGSVLLFQKQIQAFRDWMAKNGYRNKPLAITEFGILLPQEFGYTPTVISSYLEATFSWLDSASDDQTGYPADQNHLVQKWAWFSLSDPIYTVSNLSDLKSGALTPIGSAYSAWIKSHHH